MSVSERIMGAEGYWLMGRADRRFVDKQQSG
jgi:hypothetical protein